MIKLIDVNKIYPHPHNPRKELGDLTELADSIKASGIFQNLTIVKKDDEEDKYYAVIGHRRLSAAKKAGLKEVPCVISDMDYKTQLATMLLENMQRSDLTVYEQAQGFQMMLDVGETINDISDKTGFSETTVRRRIKLLELDQEKLKETAERNVTLEDYAKLEKIECLELRNEVLDTIGTSNFNWQLNQALSREERDKNLKESIDKLSKFAIEIDEQEDNMTRVDWWYNPKASEIEVPKDFKETNYYFTVISGGLYLYKDGVVAEEQTEEEKRLAKEREEREKRKNKLSEITRRAYELRKDFIQGLSNTTVKKHMGKIIGATAYQMESSYSTIWKKDMAELIGIDTKDKDDDDIEWKEIQTEIEKQPEKNLLILVHDSLDNEHLNYYSHNAEHIENKKLDYIYELLETLGYELSKEERQIKEGTHELLMISK